MPISFYDAAQELLRLAHLGLAGEMELEKMILTT
jgi:hypothetical protein